MTYPKLLFDNRMGDGTPVASTTETDYDVLNLRDWRPYTFWKPTALPATVTVDCGADRAADYALIWGHTLHDAKAAVVVRGSDNDFVTSGSSDVPLQSSNLLAAPEDFSHAAWNPVSVTVTANTHAAPDGSFTADTLVLASGAGSEINDSFTFDQVLTGLTFTVAVWMRADSPTTVNLGIGRQTANPIDNVACSLTTEWQRFTLSHTFASTTQYNVYFDINNANDNAAHTIQAWGAELRLGSAPYYEGIDNGPLFLPFTSASYQSWRLQFVQLTGSTMPTVAIAPVGAALEMPAYLDQGFDPRGRTVDGTINRSADGYPLGSITNFEAWAETLKFGLVTWTWLRNTFEHAWRTHLRDKPFVLAWDTDNDAGILHLVTTTERGYKTPHKSGSVTDLEFNVVGLPSK